MALIALLAGAQAPGVAGFSPSGLSQARSFVGKSPSIVSKTLWRLFVCVFPLNL